MYRREKGDSINAFKEKKRKKKESLENKHTIYMIKILTMKDNDQMIRRKKEKLTIFFCQTHFYNTRKNRRKIKMKFFIKKNNEIVHMNALFTN